MSVPSPPPRLVVPFTKMNGAGNDFVVVDNRWFHLTPDELAALAIRVCPRRTGIGADGLMALDAPDEAAAAEGVHVRMRYRNADGSLATMCGNGARCLARFAARAGLGTPEDDGAVEVVMDTDGGRYRALVPHEGDVMLEVPSSRGFAPTGLADAPVPRTSRVFRIWTGTEHAVLFVPRVADEDVHTTGGRMRRDGAFAPAGTNVNFVEVVEPGGRGEEAVLDVRTFEKGVEGETLACGTGALASAIVARLTDRIASTRVAVRMPGGTLRVAFRLGSGAPGDNVRRLSLSGPAEVVFEGTLEL